MQPLVSPVDHESRQHSTREQDESQQSESAPLLRHQFVRGAPDRRTTLTVLTITVMVLMLIAGVIIGIYLLIEQQRSIPVVVPFRLVPREEWDTGTTEGLVVPPYAGPAARHLLAVQTDTEECSSVAACSKLLQQLLVQHGDLPYNFLVSSDGWTYEALGWRKLSPLATGLDDHSLVLAFIGNFTDIYPSSYQLREAKVFCDEAVSRHHLVSSYTIVAHNLQNKPSNLFKALSQNGLGLL